MSDFKAKMHQNPKFGWGSTPDPAGELTHPGLLLRGGEGGEWRRWEGRGRERTGGECCGGQKILKIDPVRNGAGLFCQFRSPHGDFGA